VPCEHDQLMSQDEQLDVFGELASTSSPDASSSSAFHSAEARRRALLAYSAYVGHAQLVHATPQLLARAQAAKRVYLNDVLVALTSPPRDARQTRS
jgi:hypothetical protein